MLLARSVRARLAADVPKTSTHNVSRSAHLVQRRLLTRNALSAASSATRSRVYRAAPLECRRSYAIATTTAAAAATKATPKVKRDVKKAVAKKPAAKAAPKKPVKKTAAKKEAAPKKKRAVKAKPKPVKKVKKVKKKELTAEQKNKLTIKEYQAKVLKPPAFPSQTSAWQSFCSEFMTGKKTAASGAAQLSIASAKYKTLTPAEREHYNHIANERTVAKRVEYDAWIKSHTPEEIRVANLARTYLRRKVTAAGTLRRLAKLEDDRAVKRPVSPYVLFSLDRLATGDLKNISLGPAQKLIAEEWKALSASEKQKYSDQYQLLLVEYNRDYEQLYGHPAPGVIRLRSKKSAA